MNNLIRGTDLPYWFGLLITLFASWLIFRVVIRQDYRRKGSLSISSTVLEFLVFGMHANLPYLYLSTPWPEFPPLPANPFQQVVGISIAALALLATLGIMSWLGFRTSVGTQPEGLRQTGPYRWTRNPQLLTYGLLLLGCGILYPACLAGAWIVVYGGIAHLMVLTEEEHLNNLFGSQYEEYCRQVPRYIPQIGKKRNLPGSWRK